MKVLISLIVVSSFFVISAQSNKKSIDTTQTSYEIIQDAQRELEMMQHNELKRRHKHKINQTVTATYIALENARKYKR